MIATLVCLNALKKMWDHRWDGYPSLPYYLPSDLGLEEEPFSFLDGKYVIDGSRYYVKNVKIKALICVFHGIGAGRNAYMKEISRLCKEGYLVYAYDNLGCSKSEGKGIKSLGRAYETQKNFFIWLENDKRAKGLKRYAFGHSWGGYQAMLSMKKEYKIEKCVSLAGFLKPTRIIIYHAKGILKKAGKPFIRLANRMIGGKNSDVDVRDIMENSDAKLFYIVGENDHAVTPSYNGGVLEERFGKTGKYKYMIVPGSKHQALYTHESEEYLNDLLSKGLTDINSPIGLEMDIDKATNLNEDVLKAIFDFYKD